MSQKTKPNTETKPSKSWAEVQADYRQEAFDRSAKELVWILTEGGGSKNVLLLETLRQMEWAYLACAACRLAAEKP
jgi:hypothetical protein